MEKIDNLDKKILEIVMNNARIPSKEVAQVCGVSRAAVHQRIQRLIDDGVITGSGYNVNPKLLGYSTCTFIGLTLERGSMYRTVVPELLKIKEVVECHFTTGHYTMMIKVYARDNEHLMSLVNDRIQHIDGVAATECDVNIDTIGLGDKPFNALGEQCRYVIYSIFHCYQLCYRVFLFTPIFWGLQRYNIFRRNLQSQTKKFTILKKILSTGPVNNY